MSTRAHEFPADRGGEAVAWPWTAAVSSDGSPYWTLFTTPEKVARLARSDFVDSFARVVLAPFRGLVLLMSPAHVHELTKGGAERAMDVIADQLGVPCVSLGSTRWRTREDPPNTGPEPDCCFYLMERAEGYLEALQREGDAADNYVLDNPPDIVVEVGVTNVDEEKQQVYRDLGVPEHWLVDVVPEQREPARVRFVALQRAATPMEVGTSTRLSGVTPGLFKEALTVASVSGTLTDRQAAIRDVMVAHGAIQRPSPDTGHGRGETTPPDP